MRPTLDVIIPCYNSAATLQAAVESAVSQPAVENVWLIDDASFDDTRLIMSDLAAIHPKVRCEYMLENGGAAKARNWGAMQSQADFIAFLDADDVYENNVLNAAYLGLEAYSYLSLVRLKLRPIGFPEHYLNHPQFPTAWERLQMTVGGNTVFRRSIFLACGGFPQDELFQFGVSETSILAATPTPEFAALMQFQFNRARDTYRQAIALLPPADKKAQKAGLIMASIYYALLLEIERDGLANVLRYKIRIPNPRKMRIALKTWLFGFKP